MLIKIANFLFLRGNYYLFVIRVLYVPCGFIVLYTVLITLTFFNLRNNLERTVWNYYFEENVGCLNSVVRLSFIVTN